MKRLVTIALVMVGALVVLAACGGDADTPPLATQPASPPIPPPAPIATPTPPNGPNGPPPPPRTVELRDNGGLGPFEFDPLDFEFNAGEAVNFIFTSESQLHTFTVGDLGIDVAVAGGEVVEFPFRFDKPGTYELICIPHEALGMVGTITVSGTAAAPAAPAPVAAPASEVTVKLTDANGLGPFEFAPADFSFSAGDVANFTFVAESQLHTFTVDDLDIDVTVGGGETVEFSFTFDKPGTYELVCIPHRVLGMVGTITVQ